MSEIIYLSNVRLSFPHLAEPQRQVNELTGKERVSYNCEFIMAPDHPAFKQFMEQVTALARDKWKEMAPNALAMINNERKNRCFGRGEEKVNKKTFAPYEGYAGNIYLTAGRDQPPQMIQPDGSAVDPANTMAYQAMARKMYGGCRVNVAVKPWIQDNQHGRGVRCDLVAIQFAGDDQPFGEAKTDASSLFGAVQQTGAAAGGSPAAMPAAPFGMPSFLG